MTGLSRRERRTLARQTKRDRRRAVKAEARRQDAQRKANWARLAGRPDNEEGR